MMKNAFYFMLKASFGLKIFNFLSGHFWSCKKRFDVKTNVNFKICDVTDWNTNNYNTHIADFSRSKTNQTVKFVQMKKYNMRNIFLEKSCAKCGWWRSYSQ